MTDNLGTFDSDPDFRKVSLFVDINEKCRPIDRDQFYADPLDAALKTAGLGEVTGAGTFSSPFGEPLSSGVDVITEDPKVAQRFIIDFLTRLGVPKGTYIVGGDPPARSATFGLTEGIGVYLNGTDLPPEVYATSSVRDLMVEINRALAGHGKIRSYWEGPTETALYVYGRDSAEMRDVIEPVMATDRLCELARVVDLPTREEV